MYTHVGNGNILKDKDVIGVFDMRTIQASKQNKRIQFLLKEKKLDGKSVIIRQMEKDQYREEVSDISVATLKKRLEAGIL